MARLIFLLIILTGKAEGKDAVIDYSQRISASEMSEWFFGKATPIEKRKRMALNVGRVNLKVSTSLQCGKLSLNANLKAGLDDLKLQLSSAANELKTMLSGESLAIATVCYYKPNVCAHIRHFTATLQKELNMQMDNCRAIDAFIDSQAEKGRKQLQAEAVRQCIDNANRELSASQKLRDCMQKSGQARNLLYPLSKVIAKGKQHVLSSLLRVVKQSDDYTLLAQLLGEIELRENGYWVKALPRGLLQPADYVDNINRTAQATTCNTSALREWITNDSYQKPSVGIAKYVHEIIKEKISENTIRDLESLPHVDRQRACRSLGLSLAQLAIKRFTAHGQSTLTSALANDALPDALAEFYRNRSEMTFAAINAKIAAQEIWPVSAVIAKIGQLGRYYRQRSREVAAGVTARKIFNKELENECTDSFSCAD